VKTFVAFLLGIVVGGFVVHVWGRDWFATASFREGSYVRVSDSGLFGKLDFRDGRVQVLFAWLDYQATEDALYIRDPEKGDIRCQRLPKEMLNCPPYGLFQLR